MDKSVITLERCDSESTMTEKKSVFHSIILEINYNAYQLSTSVAHYYIKLNCAVSLWENNL